MTMNFNIRAMLLTIVALPALFALNASGAAAPEGPTSGRVRHLEWVELLPQNEREGYVPGPPAANHGYLDRPGSRSAGRFGQNQNEGLDCAGLARRFKPECENAGQTNMSSAVNESLDGQTVRLEGYIVPLEVASNGKATEFFLAVYLGACIHVPPPPPNQMVYAKVSAKQGPGSMYDAYAVTGVLHTHGKIVGLGGSAYTMDVKMVERAR
jgi:uncharacterized protein